VARGVSSLRNCTAGTSPLSGSGWVTSLRLFSGVWLIFTAVLLLYGTDDLSSGREPHLLRSHRRSPLHGRLSTATCAPYSARSMDLRRGGDIVRVRLRPRYPAAQSEISATPWRSGYGDTSSPRSSKLGLVPTANSPRPGSQTSLFLLSCTSTWMPLKAWIVSSLPFADFITTADCSSWELCLHQPMVLGGTDVAVAPGSGRHHRLFSLTLTYLSSFSHLGDTGAIGPGF
jgi:hypothetical protein